MDWNIYIGEIDNKIYKNISDIINQIMNSLTMTQMTIGLQVMSKLTNDFGSMDGAIAALTPLLNVFSNNIAPFYAQVSQITVILLRSLFLILNHEF